MDAFPTSLTQNNNTFSDRIKDHTKRNWGKYLGGAALGAGAMGLAGMLSDDVHDAIHQGHELHQQGQLWNTVVDKTQQGLEHLKFDSNGDTTTNVQNAVENKPKEINGWYDLYKKGNGEQEPTPDVSKLKEITTETPVQNAAKEVTQGATTTTANANNHVDTASIIEKLQHVQKMMQSKEEPGFFSTFGEDSPEAQKAPYLYNRTDTNLFGEDQYTLRRPELDQELLSQKYNELFAKAQEQQQQAFENIKQGFAQRYGGLELTPENIQKLNPEERNELIRQLAIISNGPANVDSQTAQELAKQAQQIAEQNRIQELDNLRKGVQWAREHGFGALLNGDVDKQREAFEYMVKNNILPKQLEPLLKQFQNKYGLNI